MADDSTHLAPLDIFQRDYSKLVTMISTCLYTITDKLYSKNLISEEVHDQVITGQESKSVKSTILMVNVKKSLKIDPGKVVAFYDALKEERVFDDLTKEIDVSILHEEVVFPKFLTRYQDYLKAVYQQSPISHDDKLSISPCSDFINLALVHKDQPAHSNDRFTNATLHGGVDEISATKTPVEMDALVTPDTELVLVEGPPGIGKSTLCWELCRKWDTLKSLQDFKIVLLLKLRERRVQNATSLHDLFYHDDKRLCECIVDLVFSCNGEGVLLILDGFDEMPRSLVYSESALLMRLLKGMCLPKATRLVTSRPSALHLKNSFANKDYCHVEILGFDDEHKRKFAEITFKSEPNVLKKFLNFILSNPVVKSLMYIPINCAIIAQVYKDLSDITVPKTMTQLYTLLVLVLIRRHLIQTGRWTVESGVPDNLEGLPEDIKADLMRIGALAYEGLMNKDVQLVFTEVGETLGLLNEYKEMYVFKGAVAYYYFPHLSMQEFLAAWYVSCHPEVANQIVCSMLDANNSVKRHLFSFGRFLSGNGCHDVLTNALRHNHGGMYFLSCCYEAQDASGIELLKYHNITILNPLSMYMFGYVLVHASVKWSLHTKVSFDVLESSVSDHAPDGLVLGSVVELELLSQLDFIPSFVQHSVKAIRLNDAISSLIYLFVNLHQVDLYLNEISTEAVQSLWHIVNLKILTIHELGTVKEEALPDLCKLMSTHCNVEKVEYIAGRSLHKFVKSFVQEKSSLWKHQKLVQAALSNHSLKCLITNIPFTTSNYFTALKTLSFNIGGNMCFSKKTLTDCLCCIAQMCEFLTEVGIFGTEVCSEYCNIETFLAILNNSLQCNRSLSVYSNCLAFPTSRIKFLSRALRKYPTISTINLRRSESYSGDSEDWLSLNLHFTKKGQQTHKTATSNKGRLLRRFSCPDILELQSLSNMHPQLQQAIGLPSSNTLF